MTESKRLLVLVLDAAESTLLKQWAADGTMPNLAAMLATGLSGDTCNVEGFFANSVWPSFSTGLNPGRHGIYGLEPVDHATYRTRSVTSSDFARCKSIWEVLSDDGRRVLVLDVPLVRLSPGLNGMQVVEWGTHDRIFGMRTTPASLKGRILGTFGEHPMHASCDVHRSSQAEYRQFADQLVRGAAARAKLAGELLTEAQWDFAIQVFGELHCGGHQLWHFHDPGHPGFHDPATRTSGDLLRTTYIAVDAALGEILQRVDADTTVLVVALHGMATYAGASLLLRQMLTRLGATVPPGSAMPVGPIGIGRRLKYLARTAYHLIPQSIRLPIYEFRARVDGAVLGRGAAAPIDPWQTKCFPINLGTATAGIRLNIRGREPSGTITPGAETDAFCAQLAEQLHEFVDPDTGRPLVQRVLRTTDICHGPWTDELPDLVVEWSTDKALGSAGHAGGAGSLLRGYSPRIGPVEVVNQNCRSGDHRPEGMFIARGPGVPTGRMGRVTSILDFAPTIAVRLGSEMPDVDGAVIPELAGYSGR